VFLYPTDVPARSLNFLARALLRPWQREFGGTYLFERVSHERRAHFRLLAPDLNWLAGREDGTERIAELTGDSGRRYLLVDSRDDSRVVDQEGVVSLKVSLRTPASVRGHVICVPYVDTVDDCGYYPANSTRRLDYGAAFVGNATPYRTEVLSHVAAKAPFPVYFRERRECFLDRHLRSDAAPYNRPEEAERREARQEYLDSALRSRHILALAGHGANTSRFFESMALGIAPILVTGSVSLPFTDQIPYEEFSLHLDTHGLEAAETARRIVDSVTENWSLAPARGRLARLYYDSYLSRARLLYHIYLRLREILADPRL
jgi:hypothetical protein